MKVKAGQDIMVGTRRKYNGKDKSERLINIRVTPELKLWLKEHRYSPSAIFNKACKTLGAKIE